MLWRCFHFSDVRYSDPHCRVKIWISRINYFQDEDEMFDGFLRDLLELAKSCDFCSSCEDSLIRDRIIIGLKDAETIDKLLEEAGNLFLYMLTL